MAKYFLATTPVRKLSFLTGLTGFLLFGLVLALPLTASAAWNDVQFTTANSNVYIPGIGVTLVVSSGSNVASFVVYDSYISIGGAYVDDTSKSSITLTSSQKQVLSNSLGLATTCGTSSSTLTITWASGTAATVTVTPSSTCSEGGGGGGGGGAVQVVTPTPAAPTTTTGTVTATASAGGKTTVTTTEGTKATVELPVAAVTADTTVTAASVSVATVTTAAAAAPAGKTIASAFQLSATSAGAAVASFAKTVTVTVTYTDSQITGLDEASLKVYRWDGTQWVVLSTTVNATTNTLTATTTAFSYFAIMGEPPAAVPVVPAAPTKPYTEMSISELQAEIVRIMALIAQLQVELAKLIAAPQAFTTDLYYGLKGNSDVVRLQDFLISKGYLAAGLNTGNYLSGTLAAVKAYQTAKGITPVNGRCGPKTRAAINADLGVSQ